MRLEGVIMSSGIANKAAKRDQLTPRTLPPPRSYYQASGWAAGLLRWQVEITLALAEAWLDPLEAIELRAAI